MMEYLNINALPEWTIYLLPLLGFILGFILRRKIKKHKKQHRFSNDYFQGLNYLLNDEQDKALDIFIKLVETDWETIDTSLALGSIFRKQGEIDKAIKLHQNLLARPSLPVEYKSTVLIALAKDYLQAGWLDRAEGLFKEVVTDKAYTEEAQQCLMSIYEQEQEWQNAVNIAQQFHRRGDEKLAKIIAQYYCEISNQIQQQNDLKEAEALATKALNVDKNCVRASMILAELAINRGKYQKSIRFLRQVEIQNAQFFPLVVDKLIFCYRNISDLNKALTYLKSVNRNNPGVLLVTDITKLINEIFGKEDAIQFLSAAIQEKPTLQSLNTLLQMKYSKIKEFDDFLPSVVEEMIDKQPDYQCAHCGYSANTHGWLCPSCHSWSTMTPKSE